MSTVLFLTLRVLHIFVAALWIGATVFVSFVLMPAINDAGPAGGQVMLRLNRKGLVPFFAALGGLTILTGIFLYWRFTSGFDPEMSRTHAGMAFGIGGLAGLLALIVGGSVVGRGSKKLVAIMEQAMTLPDGPQKASMMQEAGTLRQRISSAGLLVIALQAIALLLMSLAHYI